MDGDVNDAEGDREKKKLLNHWVACGFVLKFFLMLYRSDSNLMVLQGLSF